MEETYCAQIIGRSELTSLAFDPPSHRLLVATRVGVVQLFRTDGAEPENIFSVQYTMVPRTVAFGPMDADVRSVLVFDQAGGRMYVFRAFLNPVDAGTRVVINGRNGEVVRERSMGRIM
jgi:hypothetical protein